MIVKLVTGMLGLEEMKLLMWEDEAEFETLLGEATLLLTKEIEDVTSNIADTDFPGLTFPTQRNHLQ